MKRLASVLLLLSACSAGDESSVRIDLTALWQEAAQTPPLIELFTMAELTVTGAGMSPIVQSIDLTDPVFEVDVPSGAARTFAFEGYEEGDPDHLTQYWGYTREDLPAGGEIEITIPITTAGRLPGDVSMLDEAPVPASVTISFDYYEGDEPIPELPGPFVTEAVDGTFSLPLPLGGDIEFREYQVSIEPVTIAGQRYQLSPQSEWAFVEGPGISSRHQLLLEPICTVGVGGVECCSTADCDGSDVCNLQTHVCETVIQTATVVVINPEGDAAVGATVLVHDSTGGTLRDIYTTVTGGQIDVTVDSGDMVSVLHSFESDGTEYYLLTAAGVEPGDTLRFVQPGRVFGAAPPNLIVSPDGNPPGTLPNQYACAGDSGLTSVPVGANGTLYLTDRTVGDEPSTIDVLGWVDDVKEGIIAFAKHTDLSPTIGALTLSGWDQSPLDLALSFNNVPALVTGPYLRLFAMRDGVSFELGQDPVDVVTTMTYVLPTGFFDYVDVRAQLNDWPSNWDLVKRYRDSDFGADTIDVTGELLPAVTGITREMSSTARPIASWSTVASPADYNAAVVYLSQDQDTFQARFVWIAVASPGTTSLQIPDMSDSRISSDYRPENYTGMYWNLYVELVDVSTYTGYRQFLEDTGVWNSYDRDIQPWPEEALTVNRSWGWTGK